MTSDVVSSGFVDVYVDIDVDVHLSVHVDVVADLHVNRVIFQYVGV